MKSNYNINKKLFNFYLFVNFKITKLIHYDKKKLFTVCRRVNGIR